MKSADWSHDLRLHQAKCDEGGEEMRRIERRRLNYEKRNEQSREEIRAGADESCSTNKDISTNPTLIVLITTESI